MTAERYQVRIYGHIGREEMELEGSLLVAFLLTLFAGLATGVGGAIAFFAHRTNTRFLAVALGFSAGVMLYVSFVEILPKSFEALESVITGDRAVLAGILGFFGGMLLIAIIDKLVPSFENPHELHVVEDMRPEMKAKINAKALHRMGILSAVAIAIHNFPEGLVTFMAAIKDPALGLTIAIAIAIHNIPEGIAVSVPLYYATGSRRKAFFYSFLSGLAEPLGAVLGYFVLRVFIGDAFFGVVFAGVAGIMVFISLDQLLPTAERYGEHHLCIYGVVSGMAVMAASLVLLG
jgi:ZIP family zinc transporter